MHFLNYFLIILCSTKSFIFDKKQFFGRKFSFFIVWKLGKFWFFLYPTSSHLSHFLHLLISLIKKIRKNIFKPQNALNQLITFPFHRNSKSIIKFFSAIFNFNENPRHLMKCNNQLKCISEAKRSCQSKKWIKVLMNVISITIEQLFKKWKWKGHSIRHWVFGWFYGAIFHY